MEAEGLVTKTASGSNRTRFSYSITESGLTVVKNWLSEPPETEIIRYEILLKLYFGYLEEPRKLAEYIQNFRKIYHLRELKQLEHFEAELRSVLTKHENHPMFLMTIAFGQKVYRAYIEWCDQVLKQIRDLAPTESKAR